MPQQQQSGQDNSLDFLWTIAFIIGVIIVVWYVGREYISLVVFHVRIYEIMFVNFVINLFRDLIQILGLPFPIADLSGWLDFINKNMGSKVSFSVLADLSTAVGNYIRYPLILLMIVGAYLLYFTGYSRRFRHVFSTKTLKTAEQKIWPQITPVVKLDLVNKKLDELPWAIGLSPMRFCKKYDLLNIEEKKGVYKVSLRRGKAYQILSLQLGPKWNGVEALPIHLKALFAIFIARINNDKKGSEDLLDEISASASGTNIDFSGVDALLRKHIGSKKVGKVVGLHGYVTTLFASMLVRAREVGVLATAEFIWLKPVDRRMWYMLNTVGRATAISEICGAFAHWLAEKRLGLPLTVPMIDEAVKGLEVSLSEMIYKPEEED